MDKATAHKTTFDFFTRMFVGQINVDEGLPQEEEGTCEPGTVDYGLELEDTVTGRKYYLIREVHGSNDQFEGDQRTYAFVAWFHKDIPGTWNTPPDVDTVTTEESQSLYPVLLQVARDIFDHRLEYAHQAFGEPDET